MEKRRLLELALESLKAQKDKIELEIRALSKGVTTAASTLVSPKPAAAAPKRKGRTAAQRKAQAEKMRAYWAKRMAAARPRAKAKAAKPAKPAKSAKSSKPARPRAPRKRPEPAAEQPAT
jgi:hypothetical protein